jgi:tRNA (guanine-N7-)-methyltransferase
MSRHKQKRFAEAKQMGNIIEPGKPQYLEMAGNWGRFFQNDQPIVLELACGKGEYTYGLSKAFPQKNFIGMDIKGSRMYVGAKSCLAENLGNAGFLRGNIQNLRTFFGWREVSEIWITFPDPRPRNKDEKRRLTFSRFLSLYQHVLKEDGIVHLKTDNRPLMDYTIESVHQFGGEILALTYDLYVSPYQSEHLGIKTHYETLFSEQGFSINYCRFRLPVLAEPLGPPDPIYIGNGEVQIFP